VFRNWRRDAPRRIRTACPQRFTLEDRNGLGDMLSKTYSLTEAWRRAGMSIVVDLHSGQNILRSMTYYVGRSEVPLQQVAGRSQGFELRIYMGS
jgi:hypothetical protein